MEAKRRLARVVLGPGAFGRPILATPGIPSDRVKLLRDAYTQMLKDPEFLADANKRQWEINPSAVKGWKLGQRGYQSAAGNHRADEKSNGRMSWGTTQMNIEKYIVKARPGVVGGKSKKSGRCASASSCRSKGTFSSTVIRTRTPTFMSRSTKPKICRRTCRTIRCPTFTIPTSSTTLSAITRICLAWKGRLFSKGKVHKIVSPACVYIPTGAVHEYKVTRGAGTVTVLFRNRGYTHEDKQPT